ncbi:MAG: chemotaxis protein histidine kinase CheA [Gammaproteobacteria bacterium]|jgi:chemotaxis protein histidine kinase CheA
MAEDVGFGADELRVSFASDINPLLAEAFLEEAPLHARRFSEVMGRLASDSASFDDVVLAQRVAHSLKGSASITGVSAIVSLTHQAEDILDWLADNRPLPPVSLREMLVDTADCVAAMVDALTVQGPVPQSTERVLARLYQWREQHMAAVQSLPPANAEALFDAAALASPLGVEQLNADITPAPPSAGTSTAATPESAPGTDGAVARSSGSSLRVPVSLVDRLLRLAGELAITNAQAQGAQHRMAVRANHLREQYHLLQQRLSDLQDLVEIRGVPSRAGNELTTNTLLGDFDPLEMDEYNELHSKNTALAEAVTDFCELALEMRPELTKLEDTVADQQRISKEFSDSVLSARMVPVGSVEQRLARTVRETCRATDKQAELLVIGGAISVDGDVLNALMDPLLHLLRNAVDHGIEMPALREAAGKNPVGRLEVRFARDGENVLVQVHDDGAGFDLKSIRAVAQQRGMVAKDDFRADRELLQLTVGAGFSTRRETTEVSGRGIGMDVVQRASLDLKGSLDIISTPGNGATVSLRVPLTLISMHVLLVRAGSQIFGVPSGSLQQVLSADRAQLRDEGAEVKFTKEESEYSVRRLDQLVGRAADAIEHRRLVSMLMLEADSGPTAIVVDEALDGLDVAMNNAVLVCMVQPSCTVMDERGRALLRH